MKTLILYDEKTLKVIDHFDELENAVVEGNSVNWHIGELKDIRTPFILLEGKVEVKEGDDVSAYIQNDIKGEAVSKERKRDRKIEQIQKMINTMLVGGGAPPK